MAYKAKPRAKNRTGASKSAINVPNNAKSGDIEQVVSYSDGQLKKMRRSQIREEIVRMILTAKLEGVKTSADVINASESIEEYIMKSFEEEDA